MIIAARFQWPMSALRVGERHARFPLDQERCTTRPTAQCHAQSHVQLARAMGFRRLPAAAISHGARLGAVVKRG